jgi:outer membrane immunogenic protein
MTRTRRYLAGTTAAIALSLAFTAAASAADLARPAPVGQAPVYTKAPILPYNWSGFYFGGEAGWQSSSIGLSSPGDPLTYDPRHSSFAGGGFLGYQHQFGAFVLGVEGGYVAATGNESLGATPAISIFVPGLTGTAQAKLKDIWTAGARAGWAVNNWMPYVTGGYASGRFEFDAQDVGAPITEQANSTNSGAYFGAGIDWAPMMNGLIVGVEYRHYDFSTSTVTGVNTAGGSEPVKFAPTSDTVMGRVSYKFGGF